MKTKKAYLVAAVIAASSSWTLAQATSGPDSTSVKPATSQPAIAPALAMPDYVKDLIDTYDAAAEKAKFYQAAGATGELTEQKFSSAAGKDGSFVRQYDSWAAMKAFDKTGKGAIDAFEAADYRADLRKKVLAMFDADKDGKLLGAERVAANRWLSGGRLAAASQPGDRAANLAEMLKKYDADGDGKLSDEERQAMMKALADQQQRQMLDKYDTNGNGKLDPDELKAMQADQREQNKDFAKRVEDFKLKHFDVDGDGKLDEAEQAAAKEFEKQLQEVGKEFDVAMNDRDGDGKVSDEERKLAAEEWKKAGLKVIAKAMRYMDADGDGQVTIEERQAFGRKVQNGVMNWMEDFMSQYSRQGNGLLLTKAERDEAIQGLRDEMAARRAKYDADRDGHLNPDETIRMLEDFAKEIGITPGKPTSQPAK